MNDFLNTFFSKATLMVVVMFGLGLFLGLKIEELSTEKHTLYPLLGLIPSFVIFYFYFVKPTIKK